jgi:hypothetical protein
LKRRVHTFEREIVYIDKYTIDAYNIGTK